MIVAKALIEGDAGERGATPVRSSCICVQPCQDGSVFCGATVLGRVVVEADGHGLAVGVLRHHGIGHGVAFPREVAGIGGTAVNVCHRAVGLFAVIIGAEATNQGIAIQEHAGSGSALGYGPAVTYIDSHQFVAIAEHIAHLGNVGCVEGREVKFGQCRATIEHVCHRGDIRGVEVL